MNKIRLIMTGATGGIGQAILKKLAPHIEGAIINGLEADILDNIKKELNLAQCYCVPGDINHPNVRETIFNRAQHLSKINLVINNAGFNKFSLFHDLSDDDFSDMMQANLIAPMHLIKKILPLLKHDESCQIINTGSVFGYLGYPGFVSYCAGKFGLRGFSQALRRELADTNIQVRYFAPRATKTSFNTSNIDEMNKLLGNKSDLPEQVANAFYQFIKQKKWQKILGFKESFFVFINNLLPAIPDKAISKQLNIIKRFL